MQRLCEEEFLKWSLKLVSVRMMFCFNSSFNQDIRALEWFVPFVFFLYALFAPGTRQPGVSHVLWSYAH